MIFVLFYTTIITPYNVAFIDYKNRIEVIYYINFVMNYFFGLDLILHFFSCYFDEKDELIVDLKKIA